MLGVQAQHGLGRAQAVDAAAQGDGKHHHFCRHADLQAVGQHERRINHLPVDQHHAQHRQKQQRLAAQVPARGHRAAPHGDHGRHGGQQRASAGQELVQRLRHTKAASQAEQGRAQRQPSNGLHQPVHPRHLVRFEEAARKQRAQQQPQAGQHHVAALGPPGPVAPQVVGGVAVEAGQRQQGERALANVEAVGRVAEAGREHQVVDQQGQQDAVADAVEQPLVLAPLQVFSGVPDRQVECGGGFVQQPGVDGVGAGARQLQAQQVALAAQRPGGEGLRQAGVHWRRQRLAGGVERAVETHVLQRRGVRGQHPVASGRALRQFHLEPVGLCAAAAGLRVRRGHEARGLGRRAHVVQRQRAAGVGEPLQLTGFAEQQPARVRVEHDGRSPCRCPGAQQEAQQQVEAKQLHGK